MDPEYSQGTKLDLRTLATRTGVEAGTISRVENARTPLSASAED